jgi:hypothetical protein
MKCTHGEAVESRDKWAVAVPDGERGDWKVETFEIDKEAAKLFNLRAMINRRPIQQVVPGVYKRLTHRTRGVIMSNTRFEIITNADAYIHAKGRVLINGLGLGMLLSAILSKPDVTYVRVIEIEPDVIALVGPTFAGDPRVEILQADALEYRPARGERFDFVWHDIWGFTGADMIPTMSALKRRYSRLCEKQAAWTEHEARSYARESRAAIDRARLFRDNRRTARSDFE